jgi:hypothetical protein
LLRFGFFGRHVCEQVKEGERGFVDKRTE